MLLAQEALRAPDDPDQTLVTYTAEPGSPSQASLRLLASWHTTGPPDQPERERQPIQEDDAASPTRTASRRPR
jgi:hypothetical protein